MKNALLVLAAIALAPAGVFAVDGVTLINQSTVMAAGGFPYVINLPGSYKLSGNLTMTTSQNGNLQGNDLAIGISASNVSLDLNGFTIFVVNNLSTLDHQVTAVSELGSFSGISIRNGGIVFAGVASAPNISSVNGVFLGGSAFNRVEDLYFSRGPNGAASSGNSVFLGAHSLLRHFVTDFSSSIFTCPSSVLVENVGLFPGALTGCQAFLNAPF